MIGAQRLYLVDRILDLCFARLPVPRSRHNRQDDLIDRGLMKLEKRDAVAAIHEVCEELTMHHPTIGKEEVVEFLMHLLQHLSGPLLIIWDRLPAHRSRLVAEFVRCLEGEIEIEYLPAYAPELNPVEYLWGHWKHHELPNVCPRDLWQLSEGARRTLRRLRRRPTLITAFWKQASLFE